MFDPSGRRAVHTFTIAKAGTTSAAINIVGGAPVALMMPADWDAADITFQASADGGTTYYDVYDDAGNKVTLTVAADRYVGFDSDTKDNLSGVFDLKLVASASQTSAARTLYLVTAT